MSEFEVVDAWLDLLRTELDLVGLGEIDVATMLVAVRAVAHGVIHPAGPVAMFAVGYAAARAGGSTAVVEQLLVRTVDLAAQFDG